MSMLKTASLEITLELNAICPECEHHNDLRENDYEIDYFWSHLATERLNGKFEIKEAHECFKCGTVFEIDDFEIL